MNHIAVKRALRFFKYLPRHGFSVHVICSRTREYVSELPNVTYVPNPISSKSDVGCLAGILALLPPMSMNLSVPLHAFAAANALMSKMPVSAIISTSPPEETHFVALWLKKLHGVQWIADFRDCFVGAPWRDASSSLDPPFEELIFQTADAIIATTDTLAERWERKYPLWSAKIHVIPNGFDPEESFGAAPIPPRAYQVLAHVGTVSYDRNPAVILDSLNRLITQGTVDPDKLRVRLIGEIYNAPMSYTASSFTLAEKGVLQIISERIPVSDALREISTADYLLLLDMMDINGDPFAVPGKLYEYVLTGRPILAVTSPNSPIERILENSNLNYACIYSSDSAEEVDQKILEFFMLSNEPRSPSAWFLDKFDGEKQVISLCRLLNQG
jgi:glycosyltransferase involved in cell wall biosynthesis